VTQVPELNELATESAQSSSVSAYPDIRYDLFATVNHRGSLQSGHYVTNIKVGAQWHHCNDAVVDRVEETSVLNADGAYMLFYTRSKSHGSGIAR
jgi:ubiquitin C-terminal hydrolase